MKLLICSLAVMVLGFAVGGCTEATPAYTAHERYAQITRNWHFENEEMNDDIDFCLMLRPESRLTLWNVYHRN